ncbi:MAG: hypothetical protein ABWY01_10055, partial [Pseudoxanthomonas sp.]
MTALAVPLFWCCVGLVAYAYLGYPLLTRWLASRYGQEPRISAAPEPTLPMLTVVVCAFDEETRIGARISDIL